MSEPTVQRTLVKSPPELWAEVSDADALARHLGAFGEIRITRLDPETTVAWEGERASGTVELVPSGWGTKVTLTAELRELEAALAPPPPEPAVVEEPEAVEEPQATVELPVLEVFPPPVERPRGGFFARLFGRGVVVEPVIEEDEAVAEVAAPVVVPEPEPEPVAVVADPEPGPAFSPERAQDALSSALDSLGAAHHRPFSRG